MIKSSGTIRLHGIMVSKVHFLIITVIGFAANIYAAVAINWVTVDNAGNASDPATGYGSVSYTYQIGKYEVTNAEYGAFLNAKAATDPHSLYNDNMASYGITRIGVSGSYSYLVSPQLAGHPVVFVSWFDAARFSNWLHNNQGDGDTETGSYTLSGINSGIVNANPGATVYLPTEDEWYKAAYFNGSNNSYSSYPNIQDVRQGTFAYSFGSTWVGTHTEHPSFYGTFDQGGNVWEWTGQSENALYLLRGSSWDDYYTTGPGVLGSMLSIDRHYFQPRGFENFDTGFRIAGTTSIPEPQTSILILLAGVGLAASRNRIRA